MRTYGNQVAVLTAVEAAAGAPTAVPLVKVAQPDQQLVRRRVQVRSQFGDLVARARLRAVLRSARAL